VNRKLRILSSEDDEGIRALLFSLLSEHGHEVEFARCSDEIFKNLGRAKYDLLILDVNTPGINGYKVAEKISENITNRPKILIYTARDIREEELQFTLSGADAIVQKGASCEKVICAIDELFSASPPRPVPAGDTPPAPEKEGSNMPEAQASERSRPTSEKIHEDLRYCIAKTTQLEDSLKLKNIRYEEFIRDLLKEKQRTEKNYLEFKRIEGEVLRLKNWGYAVAAISVLAIIRSWL